MDEIDYAFNFGLYPLNLFFKKEVLCFQMNCLNCGLRLMSWTNSTYYLEEFQNLKI